MVNPREAGAQCLVEGLLAARTRAGLAGSQFSLTSGQWQMKPIATFAALGPPFDHIARLRNCISRLRRYLQLFELFAKKDC